MGSDDHLRAALSGELRQSIDNTSLVLGVLRGLGLLDGVHNVAARVRRAKHLGPCAEEA
jgi:hypothetical protein